MKDKGRISDAELEKVAGGAGSSSRVNYRTSSSSNYAGSSSSSSGYRP
jgi:hypothetical protein